MANHSWPPCNFYSLKSLPFFIALAFLSVIIISIILLLVCVQWSPQKQPELLIIGGTTAKARPSMELYSLKTTTSALYHLKNTRPLYAHVCALLNEETILITGGENNPVNTMLLKMDSGKFVPAADMNTGRMWAAAASLNGNIWVCGGYRPSTTEYYSSCEVFRDGKWEFSKSMNCKRAGHALVAVEEGLYALSGVYYAHGRYVNTRSVEKYISSDDGWEYVASLKVRRTGLAAAVLAGDIFACGGWSDTDWPMKRKSCERYSVRADKWLPMTPMLEGRVDFAMVPVGGRLYAVTGQQGSWTPSTSGNPLKSIEVFNPDKNQWNKGGNLALARSGHCIVVV